VAGVELRRSFAAASAVVERRQASALRSARAAPKRGSWTTRLSAFRLPSFFSFLALRAQIGMTGRIPPPASLNDRSKANVSCRFCAALPQASDADRIARTMPLGLAAASFRTWRRRTSVPPNGFASRFGES